MKNFDNLLIQCSMINSIMGVKKESKSYLYDLYCHHKYGIRPKLLGGQQVDRLVRGNLSEKDSVKLASIVTGEEYYRVKKKVSSEYLTGSVDLLDADNYENATKIIEIKTISKLEILPKRIDSGAENSNIIQLQAYLALTGKNLGELIYCLPKYSDGVIAQQKDHLFMKMCKDGIETEKFLTKWDMVESKLKFEDIPPKERVVRFVYERDEKMIEEIHEAVIWARKYLNKLQEKHG